MSASASTHIVKQHQTICIENIEKYTQQYIDGNLVLTLTTNSDIEYLELSNYCRELPELSPTLITLNCSNNKITKLPENLPKGLMQLYCFDNQLTQLPEHLPEGLIQLYCFDNQLTQLPEHLPQGLTELYCQKNQLTQLPEKLPEGLLYLYCQKNQLTQLPEKLPEGLLYLHCFNNKLTKLPEKLPQGLKYLYCNKNQLEVLPDLPNTLIELCCSDNNLQKNYPDIEKYSNLNGRIEYINRRNHEMREEPEIVDEGYIFMNWYSMSIDSCIVKNNNKIASIISPLSTSNNNFTKIALDIYESFGLNRNSISSYINQEINVTHIINIIKNNSQLSIDLVVSDNRTFKKYRYIHGM